MRFVVLTCGLSIIHSIFVTELASSQEKNYKGGVAGKLLMVTQYKIQKKVNVGKDILAKDFDLIVHIFDDKGRLVFETKPGTEKGDFIDAVLKKEQDDPLSLVASAWYDSRVTKKLSSERPILYADLKDVIEDMVRLTIRSKPAGAEVYLRTADNFVGTTEVRRWVPSGKVWVRLKLDGYDTFEKEIDVPSKNHAVTIDLKRQ